METHQRIDGIEGMVDPMIIEMENIDFKRRGKTILRNVSWKVEEGENWAIVGLNGSGKTTLLNLVNGYLWPTSGRIAVFGQQYGKVVIQEVRKRIGWVSSSLQLQLPEFATTEQIIVGGKYGTIGHYDAIDPHDQDEVIQLLHLFRCENLLNRTYQTCSQGERQKVLIARALIAKPELLILDEPCTGLDLISREQVLSMIEQIALQEDGPTLIYVTHHIEEILPCFSHTLLLKDGKVFQAGRTDQLLTPQQLSAFFQVPITIHRMGQRQWVALDNV